MYISSSFDSGNIEIVSAENHQNIELKIRKDNNSDFYQWFYFRLQDVKGLDLKVNILNASEASYPEGWLDYQAVISYDRITWFRVPTSYNGQKLIIELMAEYNSVFIAYFAPYSYEQHLNLLSWAQMSPKVLQINMGQTVQGRDLDLLIIGDEEDENKKRIWIIARQHPGESMAEWFIEGFLNRLLDDHDPVSLKLLQKAVFYVVPNVNPDGSILGNHRTNAAGTNLNREWANPDPEKAPEVYHILNTMELTGVDLNLDIHGDEGLAYNFISSIEGIPAYDAHLKMLDETFSKSWERISPDFQTKQGYPKNEAGKANLNICAKAIGEKFKCLSLTIEMPFKDNMDLPNEIFGWSPQRSMALGASVLNPIVEIVDDLRKS
jgi:murein tripeptide amidase MpaA